MSNNILSKFDLNEGGKQNEIRSIFSSGPSTKSVSISNSTPKGYNINPFIDNVTPVFDELLKFEENSSAVGELDIFRDTLIKQIEAFEQVSNQQGLEHSQIVISKYIVCALVDERVSYNHEEGEWASNSLLNHFYDETYGGERFFGFLEYLLKTPAAYIQVLELMYLAVCIGFKGKYRVLPDGNQELEKIKNNLYSQIRIIRGVPPREISPDFSHELIKSRTKLFFKVPIIFLVIITLSILGSFYVVFSLILNNYESDLLITAYKMLEETFNWTTD